MMHIFEEFNLKTTATANQKITNFLDITLNLSNGSYQPFKKPNDDTIYIHSHSNHPPSIIRHLSISISQRISTKLSSDHATFQLAAPTYNNVLKHRGFRSNIEFPPDETHTHLQQVIRKTEQEILLGSTHRSVRTLKPTSARNFLTYSTITFDLLIP